MIDTRQRVLLVAYINSHLPELLRTGASLQQTGRFRVDLLFVDGFDVLKQTFLDQCSSLHTPVYDILGRERIAVHRQTENAVSATLLARMRRRPLLRALLDWLHGLVTTLLYLPLLVRRRRRLRKLIHERNIKLMLLAEENAAYQTNLAVLEARRAGAASIVIPYTIANATEAAEHAYDTHRLWVRGPLSRLIARLYPKWTFRYRGRRLLFMPALRILATELLRLAPPDPWMINSGFADAIAVESPFMREYYRTNGIPESRLVLTGSVSDDLLFHARKNVTQGKQQLAIKYHVDPDKPLLLTAFPPPWFPRPGCDFADYPSLMEFWLGALRAVQGWNSLISLHPGISKEDRERIAEFGIPVAQENVVALLPLCNAYVASISATIRWAIALGIPVLNYDVYKYQFHDYDTAAGVMTIEIKEDFLYTLKMLTSDNNYFQDAMNCQRDCQKDWGMLDGRCGERLLGLIERLTHTQ